MNWHLQDAKNNFSKVVRLAQTEGPQTVTVRGEPAAVVISAKEFDRMKRENSTADAVENLSFTEFLLSGPAWTDDMAEAVNQRSKDTGRDIEF